MGALTGACAGIATGLGLVALVGVEPAMHSFFMILANSAFCAMVGWIFPDLWESK